ncbi:hypothetical protein FHT76_003863 [Rhizobium sp. BK176]|nr:hypothetical protein [Rhizobium sp. BK176]
MTSKLKGVCDEAMIPSGQTDIKDGPLHASHEYTAVDA